MKKTLQALAAYLPSLQYRRSYAKDNLDKRLDPFIGRRKGFFIEAGANDGVTQSNSLYFERYLGWRGILIEPVPELARKCRAARPHCAVEEVALVREVNVGTIELTVAGLMTTTVGAFASSAGVYSAETHLERAAKYYQTDGQKFERIGVNTKTLSQIIDENYSPEVDLLSLDVEGFEYEALMGLDLAKHRPRYILVEERPGADFTELLGRYYRKEAVLAFSQHYQDVLYSRLI